MQHHQLTLPKRRKTVFFSKVDLDKALTEDSNLLKLSASPNKILGQVQLTQVQKEYICSYFAMIAPTSWVRENL